MTSITATNPASRAQFLQVLRGRGLRLRGHSARSPSRSRSAARLVAAALRVRGRDGHQLRLEPALDLRQPTSARWRGRRRGFFAVSIDGLLVAAHRSSSCSFGHGRGLARWRPSRPRCSTATAAELPRRPRWSFAEPAPAAPAAPAARRNTLGLVVPTYNEAENVEPASCARVLDRLLALAQAGDKHRVLIVDQTSPDGTGEIADRLAAELDTVEVLHRAEKDGLGRAYAAGFERALAEGAELVMQMDVRFSPRPEAHPRADRGRGRRRPGDRVTLRRRRRRDRLGPRAPAAQPRHGSWYARTVLTRAGQGPDRRLQVLPARAAGGPGAAQLPHRRLRLPG